ncbi:MAG TPA: sulfotransferase [Streptosporangiaceae bacterium]|nr:sulfotransferase [Streptosporangiaceae bacterium]
MPLTFVVSASRSGSTMLSRILHAHPDVLSVSEFFSSLMRVLHSKVFPVGEMTGAELWHMLSTRYDFFDAAARHELPYPELRYPYGTGRFDPATGPLWPGSHAEPGVGVPVIATMTLPMLTDDPDGMFDQLAAEVQSWPKQPATAHYRALFDLLARLLGRSVIVERSSTTSLDVVPLLHQQFPDARFVHMHRNGPDNALAMEQHPMFRMAAFQAEVVRLSGTPSWDNIELELRRLHQLGQIPPEYMNLIIWPFDRERFMSQQLPAAFFGGMWSRMEVEGASALSGLPAQLWTSLRFEDLLADPANALRGLADLLGVTASPEWLEEGRALVSQRKASAMTPDISASDLAALRESCAPGEQAIAAAEAKRQASAGLLA